MNELNVLMFINGVFVGYISKFPCSENYDLHPKGQINFPAR